MESDEGLINILYRCMRMKLWAFSEVSPKLD